MNRAIHHTRGDRLVLAIITVLLTALLVVFAYPLLYVLFSSISANAHTVSGLSLIPKKISFEGYSAVFQYKRVWTGYLNSFLYMGVGTLLNVGMSICAAYPLSRKDLDGRNLLLALFMFTMYFSGGMIPTFLLVRGMNLLDTFGAMVLPGAMSVYNTLVMRTFFSTQIPQELREASEIDGCGNITFLVRIVLPLSLPILAVISLFYAVGHWNAYFDALLYLRTSSKYPLQLVVREILIANQTVDILNFDPDEMLILEQRANLMRYSLIVISSVPMLCIYPFVQRHFVKGIMLGAVKG